MVPKRDLDDVDDGEIPEPETKRPKKHNAKSRQHQNSSIDPTWGQKYVFSGKENATTIPVGEEDDFEDDADAMAYLNSVRQEATEIPHLLVAPKVQIGPQLPANFERDETHPDGKEHTDRTIYEDGLGDTRGYYEDGAYTAVPDGWGGNGEYEEGETPEEEKKEIDDERALHEAYFASVMDQYLHLRTILNSKPPPNALSRLSPSQHTSATGFGGRQSSPIALWSRLIRTSDPHPLQVALMSKDTILHILRVLLGGKFLRRGYVLPERTSRWLWALLARLPDKGELNHTEIGWVRDLGRRAVLLGRSLSEMAALRDELAEGGLGAHEAVDRSSSEEVLLETEWEEVEGANSPGDDEETSEAAPPTAKADEPAPKDDAEEGEVEDDEPEDVAMDLASDSDAEDGEVADEPEANLEDVKARLLAQLNNAPSESEVREEEEQEAARERSRGNLRATLNMILTVAGEFYGQRDLLEFREPFVGM
ncbi:hypothetical protein G7Z17_g6178 [Cylindrodendrum hubeiense]|uniref:V-snare n=1 Tax=Cylindrodendrum hubeiense TaxID=595255 RepID=A0A9P5H9K5_9HYPO|nr:hypothetical protein G7Z17_g6178 [Cylindrodendrum hubeiense]